MTRERHDADLNENRGDQGAIWENYAYLPGS